MSSTAVYDATAGAMAAAVRARRPTEPDDQPTEGATRTGGSSRTSSAAPATPAPGPYAVRIQVPTDIGEVGL